ncbi:RNA-binding region RNP-1 (RNA recognition motif) [Schistosoma japonicum]|nr:RNA-binding region RNP-1 (RNA recognition motif) [Schistosoma japonicum]KAH8866257.1 RNA-binding region RNP-1 (RNA recognition motif) [Schistosoma japonicum]KAH8866259.1 RNA-binding region RNP-1 (RNA recognition motif) [Schistosoma japonicum]KAH8866260.1 RNA-binding region RNP-1 (RNA recognition motif) [Schistosoma japonicum]KAH8866261.1 RNA-binding region RNP-1 (RNA recognition motif) [Schistosoma japonicum]
MDDSCSIVIEDLVNTHSVKPESVETWLAPFGTVKCISVYRRVIFVEFENPSVVENVINSENGKMFLNSHVSIRSPQPWDLMVAGDLVTRYEVPTSSEASKEVIIEEKDANASSDNLHPEVEEVKKLIAHIKYLDKDELWTLYNGLQDMRTGRGAKTKVKTLPSGRPWLDSVGKSLFTGRTEALHKLETEDNKKNRRRFIQCDHLYTEASTECEKAWFSKIDQEINACNTFMLPEDVNSMSFQPVALQSQINGPVYDSTGFLIPYPNNFSTDTCYDGYSAV